MNSDKKTTHFGYKDVDWDEKQGKVADVFHSVAEQYDIMNDVMSLGIHRLWKRFTIELSQVRPGHKVLDLAGGSGDLSLAFCDKVGAEGHVILSDINASMLEQGRNRLIDAGKINNVDFIQANAERLPFADNYFDCITIAFGLRNVTDKDAALRSMFATLKPGGKLMVLEFSKPTNAVLKPIYDIYSFSVLPVLGELIAGDSASYRYLAESIRMHPDQDNLKTMIHRAGFEDCQYHNLSGGIVALHIAYKY